MSKLYSDPEDTSKRLHKIKVIRDKSRGEGSLIEQDTIENVSEPNSFFFTF